MDPVRLLFSRGMTDGGGKLSFAYTYIKLGEDKSSDLSSQPSAFLRLCKRRAETCGENGGGRNAGKFTFLTKVQ